jgi:hypothetical protein
LEKKNSANSVIKVEMPEIVRHLHSLIMNWKVLNMLAHVRYRTKPTQSRVRFMVQHPHGDPLYLAPAMTILKLISANVVNECLCCMNGRKTDEKYKIRVAFSYQNIKPTQFGIFLFQYRTEIIDVGIQMPGLVMQNNRYQIKIKFSIQFSTRQIR